MRTKIYLIRHAEAQINADPMLKGGGDALTERGQREAQMLAERFRGLPIENVYTSKILRARLTADEIGRSINKTPIIIESLKERKVIYTNAHEYTHEETFENLKGRVIETKYFLENLPHEQMVVVSHALFLRAFLGYIVFGDLLTEELLQRVTRTFVISNAAISIFEYNQEKERWHVESWNDRAHLS